MARYIDADKLAEYITTNYCKNCDIYDGEKCNACPMNDALNYIETFQTADVVPKSEVDKLNKELDNLAEELSDLIVEKDKLFDEVVRLRTVLDEYEETSGLKQAKAEVAREIFEEIDKILKSSPTEIMGRAYYYKCIVDEDFAELKKKYTEDKT